MSNFSENGANIRQPVLATSVNFKKPATQNPNLKVSDNLVNTLTQQSIIFQSYMINWLCKYLAEYKIKGK